MLVILTNVALFLAFLTNTGLAAFILVGSHRRYRNIIGGYFILAVTLWIGMILLLRIYLTVPIGELAYSLASFIPATLLSFVSNFPRPSWQRSRDVLIMIPAVIFSAISFVPGALFAGAPHLIRNSIVPERSGPAYHIYLLYFLLYFGLAIYQMTKNYRRSRGLERVQLKYLVIGISTMIGLSGICSIVLTAMGIYALNSIGPVFTIIMALSISYAIIRHRLFDIRLVIARTLAYVLVLGTIAGVYAAGAFGLVNSVLDQPNLIGYRHVTYVILALILAVTYQPLRRFFGRLTNHIFYRDSYETQDVLDGISRILVTEISLEAMLPQVLARLCHDIQIDSAQFVIYEQAEIYTRVSYGHMDFGLSKTQSQALQHSVLVADELEHGRAHDVMEKLGIRVSLMLRTRDEFVGFLFLGDKLSGDIYSSQDMELLEILSRELSIAVNNAKSYQKIERFNITLQERVDEATKRLRAANHNLKTLDRAKDEFLSVASHQLRTPLTAIRGNLSLLLGGLTKPLDPQQRDIADDAMTAAERVVHLVSDLLSVSRLNSGRFVSTPSPTNLITLIDQQVNQLRPQAAFKHLDLTFSHPTRVPLVNVDENNIRQVVMNFIDNAIYYTHQGTIKVALEVADGLMRVTVTDTGIGVPAEAQKKLFDKFYRAENATELRPDGTGLGLFLAKKVIELQGGQLIFHSVENQGSTFGFELALESAKASAKA